MHTHALGSCAYMHAIPASCDSPPALSLALLKKFANDAWNQECMDSGTSAIREAPLMSARKYHWKCRRDLCYTRSMP
jgi:hypothetical protein